MQNIEHVTVVLPFEDGSRRFRWSPNESERLIVEGTRLFAFELCRNRAQLSTVALDRWWMNPKSVYGAGPRPARYREIIIQFFWARCMGALSAFDDEVQDSYLWGLFPHTRVKGSRRVFADAVLTPPRFVGTHTCAQIHELDERLASGHSEVLSPLASFGMPAKSPPTIRRNFTTSWRARS